MSAVLHEGDEVVTGVCVSGGGHRASAKNQGVQFDQSTATRRRLLFREFSDAIRTGEGLRGILIQIDRSPFQVVDRLPTVEEVGTSAFDRIARRAGEAEAALGNAGCSIEQCKHNELRCESRRRWSEAAAFNSEVPTTLAPIGADSYASLTAHARTSTRVYLYVLHGLGDLDDLEGPPDVGE